MKQKELRKLRRTELLELMLQMQEENQELNQMLLDRRITLEQTGSIAEAALKLNKVFEAAQQAAEDYLNSIRAEHPQAPKAGDDTDAGAD